VRRGPRIVVQGLFDFTTPKNVMAVVGGTGRYAGAKGEVEFLTKSDDTFIDTFACTTEYHRPQPARSTGLRPASATRSERTAMLAGRPAVAWEPVMSGQHGMARCW
jgi:hypothetical protein